MFCIIMTQIFFFTLYWKDYVIILQKDLIISSAEL